MTLRAVDRFERWFDRRVAAAFSTDGAASLLDLLPEIRSRMDSEAVRLVDRSYSPNRFRVPVRPGPVDLDDSLRRAIETQLARAILDHARWRGYAFPGPLGVELVAVPGGTVAPDIETAFIDGPEPLGWLVAGDGARFPVCVGPCIVGRDRTCDVVLADPTVSRRHAELQVEGSELVVRDLGSRNGIRGGGGEALQIRVTAGGRFAIGGVSLTWSAPSTSTAHAEPDRHSGGMDDAVPCL